MNIEDRIKKYRESGFPKIWVADQGDGTYINPIIHADYSDPDVIRVNNDFNEVSLGHQWQWQANPKKEWYSFVQKGCLRLFSMYYNSISALWNIPNLLLQKFPAPSFIVTLKVNLQHLMEDDQVGLIIMGLTYKGIMVKKCQDKYIPLDKRSNEYQLSLIDGDSSSPTDREILHECDEISDTIYFRVIVTENARCDFEYSINGINFIKTKGFLASKGLWIGAKFGLTVLNFKQATQGYVDIDWVIVEEIDSH